MNTYTVLEVKGSKRTTKAEYNFAIIGKRNYKYAIEVLNIELQTTTYAPRILQIEKLIKDYEQKNADIIPFEVLQWSGKLLNAEKGLNNGVFQRNFTDLRIAQTEKI
jgi:hypothetical protein